VSGEGSMLGKGAVSASEKGEIRYFKTGVDKPFPGNSTRLQATAILTLYGFSDCDYAFDVFGDNMAPQFRPGDLILCSDYKEKRILPGEAYLIVANGTPAIRTVMTIKEGIYNLAANGQSYPIEESEIDFIYLIKGVIWREVF
jgi:phage repressor protein C with HTH and peptisase S24 domain